MNNVPRNLVANEMEKLMAFLTHPDDDTEPMRISTTVGSAKSAVTCTGDFYDLTFSDTTTDDLPPGEVFACVFRDPLRATVLWDPNPNGFQSSYSMAWLNQAPGDSFSEEQIPAIINDLDLNTTEYLVQQRYWVSNFTDGCHGPLLPCGMDHETDNAHYVWLDKGNFTVTCTDAGSVFTVLLDRWTPSDLCLEEFAVPIPITFADDLTVDVLAPKPMNPCTFCDTNASRFLAYPSQIKYNTKPKKKKTDRKSVV